MHAPGSIYEFSHKMASSFLLPFPRRRVEGKVALITGGASGIGECTAKLFCRHGAKVIIADVQDDKGRSVCKDIGEDLATFVHCDVTNESDVDAAVDFAVAAHGKLDIMFNNVGIRGIMDHSIVDTERSDFESIMMTNVIGSFLGTKHASRVMIPARKGSIIIMSSTVSSVIRGLAAYPYTCSKHALVGLTKDAAAELGKYGIRVNCVSPYGVAARMTRGNGAITASQAEEMVEAPRAVLKGVMLKVDVVAKAVLYLASEDARYVSGHNLLVDGRFAIV